MIFIEQHLLCPAAGFFWEDIEVVVLGIVFSVCFGALT